MGVGGVRGRACAWRPPTPPACTRTHMRMRTRTPSQLDVTLPDETRARRLEVTIRLVDIIPISSLQAFLK